MAGTTRSSEPAEAESLNVIALISGGKDSFYSMLLCLQNGHRIVALGNLYPPTPELKDTSEHNGEDEQDLNSFMYQTVGHNIIPLYETALGLPLFRQPIVGSAIEEGTSYSHSDVPPTEEDETESLIPLLKKIIENHPEANAICTGAILSTYQRTRVESVALRLGLTPLSYLWQFPSLPQTIPRTPTSLLRNMQHTELDARIIKVASGGLDESFLWMNVASENGIERLEKAMRRFSVDGDGAVLGEGGEFETLVLDGPPELFKFRIEVDERDRRVVREGGGCAWLSLHKPRLVKKEGGEAMKKYQVPEMLDEKWLAVLATITETLESLKHSRVVVNPHANPLASLCLDKWRRPTTEAEVLYWTVSSQPTDSTLSISEETEKLMVQISDLLTQASLDPTNIISTIIILRSMQDFVASNKIYGAFFKKPNPPSRVTISCGDIIKNGKPTKEGTDRIIFHLKVQKNQRKAERKALHVQSRSYWAPANIGPYSQAISIPIYDASSSDESPIRAVSIAGQIPLRPATMEFPPPSQDQKDPDADTSDFLFQAVLALQHLWRIAVEMKVEWFASVVVYLPWESHDTLTTDTRALLASRVWSVIHTPPADKTPGDDDDDERDLWEERHYAGHEVYDTSSLEHQLPDWSVVDASELGEGLAKHPPNVNPTILALTTNSNSYHSSAPPFFAAVVEGLPKDAQLEWHAHLGLSGGRVKRESWGQESRWMIHTTTTSSVSQLLVIIWKHPSKNGDQVKTCFDKALEPFISANVLPPATLTYINTNVKGLLDLECWQGVVPCHDLLGAAGEQLALVCIFEKS